MNMGTLGDVLDAMVRELATDRDPTAIAGLLETAMDMLSAVGDVGTAAELALQFGDQLQAAARDHGFPPLLQSAERIYDEGLKKSSLRDAPDLWRRLATHRANALQRSGQLGGRQDDLLRAIDAYDQVLHTLAADEDAARGVVLTNQASARHILAAMTGQARLLDSAVASFRQARAALPGGGPTGHRLMATTGLARALRSRGMALAAPDDLEEAIGLYEILLAAPVTGVSDEDRAMVLNGLGTALFRLTEINGDPALLDRAEERHQEASRIYERIGPVEDLARTLLMLGNVHVRRGERGDPAELRKAADYYQAATAWLDPAMFPSDWLDAKTNTGNVLLRLGELVHHAATMTQGRQQFADVAALLSPNMGGARWRQNEINMANADTLIARVTGDPDHLLSARARLDTLLEAEDPFGASAERRFALTASGLVEKSLADLSNDPDSYRSAISRFNAALAATDPEREPLEFERTATSLGNALTSLGEILIDADILRHALAAFDLALALTNREGDRVAWAKTQINRAIAAGLLGEFTRSPERLQEAEAGIRNGLTVYTLQSHPGPSAQAQSLLGNTIIRRARLTGRADLFLQGMDQLRAAKDSAAARADTQALATAAVNLASALEEAYDATSDERHLSEALEAAEIAVGVFDLVRQPVYSLAARKQLADVLAKMGRLDAARSRLEALMDEAADAVLSEPTRARSNLLLRRISGSADLLAFCQLEQGHPRSALASLEAGRSVSLRQALRDGVSPDTRAAAIRWRRAQLTLDALMATGVQANKEREERREALLAELRSAHDALRALRATAEPLPGPNALFASLQAAIPPDGAFVAPVISAAGSALLIVCRMADGPVTVRLPDLTDRHVDAILGDRTGLAAVLRDRVGWAGAYHDYSSELRRNSGVLDDATAQAWRAAVNDILQEIGAGLMSPLHRALGNLGLGDGAEIALLAPGRLALLPLAACPTGDGEGLFLDRWSLAIVPSLTRYIDCMSRRRARPPQPRTLLAITDPQGDLNVPASPAGGAYPGDAVTDLVGDAADYYAVTEAIGSATDICFFCHGVWSPLDPEDAYLELAQDHRLTVGRMRTINADRAELAVLAACEAGMIDLRRAPDAFAGLPSSFAEAGFPAVVSALWPIPVSATARVVERFFACYADCRSAAVALRMTQRTFRQSADPRDESDGPVHMDLAWMAFSCFGT